MPNNDMCTHLHDEVSKYLRLFDGKRQRNKFLALGIRLTGAAFAAAITILLGIDYTDKPVDLFTNLAIGLGATIAVLNTWDVFFNHRALWIRFNNAAVDMHLLRQDLDYARVKTGGELEANEAEQFHNRLQDSIRETNEDWHELRREAQAGQRPEPA